MARRRLQAIRAQEPHQYTESLIDYIPRVTPRWVAPVWLRPYVEILEEALRKPTRIVVAAPPQHGKTETTTHALVRAFRVRPHGRSAYATYNGKRVASVERKTRAVATRDGLNVEFRQDDWYDPGTGGSLVWASRNGGLTGEPVDTLLVVDDILKDRQEANSEITRQECIDWFDDVAEPRCHATASIIVMATRWHPDDLSGVLVKRGWRYLNLKALADGPADADGIVTDDPLRRHLGEPLCEDRKSRAELEQKRRTNIYSFASLYQGEPRPRGGTLFQEPTYYSRPPEQYRVGYGVDLAYTAKTSADFSVCIEGWMAKETEDGKPVSRLYITDVQRKQVDAPAFTLTLKARQSARGGPMLWFAAGVEKGAGDFIKQRVDGFRVKPATADKFIRAQPVAEAWNAGRVLVPADGDDAPEWLHTLLDEVANFTGVKDSHDDQVDALAALWEVLARSADGGQIQTAAPYRAPIAGSGAVATDSDWDDDPEEDDDE